jgi:enoyl-CoA hydratase/carnithine racemase
MPISRSDQILSYQCIETERRDGILILRHAREQKLNARCTQMYMEIMAVLADASADDTVIAVMLTAKGKYFSAGMDFQDNPKLAYEILESDGASVASIKSNLPPRNADDVRTWPAVKFIESFINFDKPLIGAVNGPAIGEGFSSLLHCDLVYAADSAYFWAPFARAGVAPEFCSTQLMPARLGRSMASAAMFLGRRISALEAQAAGFVVEIMEAGEGFEDAVLTSLQQGLALAGPPELRRQTLQSYRRLVYPKSERTALLQQCYDEFELIRERAQTGVTKAVQQHYQAQLPVK